MVREADTYVVATYDSPDPASLRAVVMTRRGASVVAEAVRNGAEPGNVILRGPFVYYMAEKVAQAIAERAEMARDAFGEAAR